jgi:2-polyprenyl-6-methoxyphenol hydroxylase-like FAD-dependent oxidoreductase
VAALLLAHAGAHVTVLERDTRSAVAGAGLLLQPNGLAVLYALGLHDALAKHSVRTSTMTIRNGRGRVLLHSAVPYYGEGLDHALVLRRRRLAKVLGDALDDAGVHVRYGAEVIDADPSGVVTYSDGRAEIRMAADIVIGADGVHSSIRRHGDFGAQLQATGQTYLRGIVPQEFAVEPVEYWTALGLFGCAPLGDGTTYFYGDATAPAIAHAMDNADVEGFHHAWRRAVPALSPLIRAVAAAPLLVNRVYRVDCACFVDRRLVVMGDAAHAMAPTLGQGANSAFVDAAVLVDELRRHAHIDEGLAAYDRRRRPPVQRVQRDAGRIARLSALRSRLARAIRDRALPVVNRPQSVRRRYDGSLQHDPAELLRMAAPNDSAVSAPLQRAG